MAPTLEDMPVTTSELTDKGVARTISETAPSSLPNSNGFSNARTHGNPVKPALPDLNASLLRTTPTSSPRTPPAVGSPEELAQKTCTDHMITVSWTHVTGWQAPELRPYGPLSLMPTASCLHYATECFEGMKLYRGYDGKLRLFRPRLNAERMQMSAARIALPAFDPEEFLKLVVKLCATDGGKWLPKSRAGNFLYIRPTMIANDPALGVQKPKEALLYIMLCCFPVVDANKTGMKLLASRDDMVRAWPGGFGFAKVGANYGPTLLCQGEARAQGFDQILWLFGSAGESLITEAGGSNFFALWKDASTGKRQLVTAPLAHGIILDGITRRSVLELARTRLPDLEIVERQFSIQELWKAYEAGMLEEVFVCGTAFFVSGVSCIRWGEKDINIKINQDGMGANTALIKNWMRGIMYGKERNEWGYVVEEEV